jgi:serine/threonine protein kinase/tetratricopeptide (TPR) repeat protein
LIESKVIPPDGDSQSSPQKSIAQSEFVSSDTVALAPGAIDDAGFGFDPAAGMMDDDSGIYHPSPAAGPAEEVSVVHRSRSGVSDRSDGGDLRVGKLFGNYRILHEIARGGMGIVYLAEQETLKRRVALKVLRAGEGASDEDLSRFMREAEAAASLSHPNIVRIHELDVHEGQPFFTMDYVEGPSLESLSEEGRVTLRQAAEITERIAQAIDYAHSHGIVHRDLKPANVIIAPGGVPKITDFGLAVNLAQSTHSQRMTHSGVVMGTIPYIPPEQAAGDVKRIGPPADIYSMGAVLYEMITGEAPFEGETQFELLHKVLNQEPIAPGKLNPRIPPDLQTICQTCMEKNISRRYPTAQAVAEDCRAFLNGELISARPVTLGYRIYRFAARQRLLVGLGSALVFLLFLFLTITSFLQEAKKETEEELVKKEREQEATAAELEDVKAKTEELTAAMDPGWREAFFDNFRSNSLGSNWVKSSGRYRLHRGALLLESGMSSAKDSKTVPSTLATTVNVGLKGTHAGDCRVAFKVKIPKETGGSLGVMISGMSYSLGGNFGYLFRMGPPKAPGASLNKGEVTLWTAPDVVLEVDQVYRVRVDRSDTRLLLAVNNEVVLDVVDENILRGDEHSRIGFVVSEGQVIIDNVRVFHPGTSQQMLVNMLDMSDTFYRNREWTWASRMATHVAQEQAPPVVHLRAVKRVIACLSRQRGGNRQKIQKEFAAFLRSMKSWNSPYRLLPGEEAYLTGLLMLGLNDYAEALKHFDKASRMTEADPAKARYILLAKLQGVVASIGHKRTTEAIKRLVRMQKNQVLTELALNCSEELRQGELQAVFLTEVDRLLKQKDVSSVGIILQTLPLLFPDSGRDFAARYMTLAQLFQEKDQGETVKEHLTAAVRLDPQWEKPRLAVAAFHQDQGEEQFAFANLEAASRVLPDSLEVHKALTLFLLDHPHLEGEDLERMTALEAARISVRLTKRKDIAVLELLSRAARKAGSWQESYNALLTANELEPSDERERRLNELLLANPELTRELTSAEPEGDTPDKE